MLDRIRYTEDLVKAGFTTNQAEAQLLIFEALIGDKMVTKQDLEISLFPIRRDIEILRKDMDYQFQDVRNEMKALENRMVIKLGAMTGTMMALGFAAMALLVR